VSLGLIPHSKNEVAKATQARSNGAADRREANQINMGPKGVETEAGVILDLSKICVIAIVLLNIVLSVF
jgi:hypothetical protein